MAQMAERGGSKKITGKWRCFGAMLLEYLLPTYLILFKHLQIILAFSGVLYQGELKNTFS
jgi:hypothetical protein